jgi:hypothetical protein
MQGDRAIMPMLLHGDTRGVDVTKDALRSLSSGLVIAGQGHQPAHISFSRVPGSVGAARDANVFAR